MSDVVVIGAGLGGLATALAAAVRGHQVTVLEKGPKVGGAAAYSGGQVWVAANHCEREAGIADSVQDAESYVRAGSAGHPEFLDEEAMRSWLLTAPVAAKYFEDLGAVEWTIIPGYPDYGYPDQPGSKANGRYLTAAFDGSRLGSWRDRFLISPYFPVGSTYDELFSAGKRQLEVSSSGGPRVTAFGVGGADREERKPADLLTFGSGVVAGFLHRARQEKVEILVDCEATELLREGNRVVGVRAVRAGEPVEIRGQVVLATSSFDWDDDQCREFLGLSRDVVGSVAPRTVDGDGNRLAEGVGAAIIRMPANCVPLPLGYPTGTEPGYAMLTEHSLPHTFIVDRAGRRFCDDGVYWDVGHRALDTDDPHLPCFMIWDDRHRQKYGMGATPPGGDYPPDLVVTRPTLAELAAALGIDGEQLQHTTERFNEYAERGEDPDHGRGTNLCWRMFVGDPTQVPNPNLGPVAVAPFHGMRVRFISTGIGLSGVSVDAAGRVLDTGGRAIDGLYAVGSCAAYTSSGTGYNSGYALSRAITFAYLVAQDLG
jgi:3-oxosteroid 1-dehydrogenase